MQGNFMPMFNPYMPMQGDMSSFPGYFNNPNAPGGGQDFNQMYGFQGMPPYFMPGEEMINPSNINLNMGMQQGSMDPNMINYLQQMQQQRNTQN